MHMPVNLSTVAEHYYICKISRFSDIRVPLGQLARLTGEIPDIAPTRVNQIAATEINSTYRVPTVTQREGEPAKKRGSRSLKGEEGALHVRTSRIAARVPPIGRDTRRVFLQAGSESIWLVAGGLSNRLGEYNITRRRNIDCSKKGRNI
jgi:hypothetical protein